MMRIFRWLVSLLLIGTVLTPAQSSRPVARAFVGARIIDGTGRPPVENGVLLVRNGRVESIGPASKIKLPPGTERVDVSGRTIMPGLINAHGHVGATKGLQPGPEVYTQENLMDQLRLYARYGVTTVVSLGGDQAAVFAIRDSQETPQLDRARLYVTGPVLTPTTPEEARQVVNDLVGKNVIAAKIRVDDNLGTTPKMPPAVYQAVIEQAHRRGLRVAAHLFYLDDAKSLLRSGVDFLAHSVRDREVNAELISLLKERDVCLCPTLMREVSTFVYEKTPDFFSDPFFRREADPAVLEQLQDPKRQQAMANGRSAQAYKQALAMASKNLKRLSDAGAQIAFGTDTGPPARFQGYFEHLELELMAHAGLRPMQIILSATRDAARCLGLADRLGTLESGKWADFIVLTGNPLTDITKTKAIESVWVAGNRVPPREGANKADTSKGK